MPRTQHLFTSCPLESLILSLSSVSPKKSLQSLESEQHLLEQLRAASENTQSEGIYHPRTAPINCDLVCGMR